MFSKGKPIAEQKIVAPIETTPTKSVAKRYVGYAMTTTPGKKCGEMTSPTSGTERAYMVQSVVPGTTPVALPADARKRPAAQDARSREEEEAIKALLKPPQHPEPSQSLGVFERLGALFRHADAMDVEWTREARREALARTAKARHGKEWRWLSTVTFWTCSSFVIGSLLFVAASLSSVVSDLVGGSLDPWQQAGLIQYGYLAGGCYFTMGAYLGWVHVINAGESGMRHVAPRGGGLSDASYWGSASFLCGAFCFQVATIVAVWPATSYTTRLLFDHVARAVGGLGFVTASIVEFGHNKHATPRQRVWWLCLFYLLGSFFFLLGGSHSLLKAMRGAEGAAAWVNAVPSLLPAVSPQRFTLWLVDLPYMVGSVAFTLGSWVQLRMWKAEQFGLGFLSEVSPEFVEASQAGIKKKKGLPRVATLASHTRAQWRDSDDGMSEAGEDHQHGYAHGHGHGHGHAHGHGHGHGRAASSHDDTASSDGDESSADAMDDDAAAHNSRGGKGGRGGRGGKGGKALPDPDTGYRVQGGKALPDPEGKAIGVIEHASMMASTLYTALAVLNTGLALAWHGIPTQVTNPLFVTSSLVQDFVIRAHVVLNCAASLVASHSLLLLAAVLHATPTRRPFGYLTHLLRLIEVLFCASEALTTVELLCGLEYI